MISLWRQSARLFCDIALREIGALADRDDVGAAQRHRPSR
jgi:hypothetical protein